MSCVRAGAQLDGYASLEATIYYSCSDLIRRGRIHDDDTKAPLSELCLSEGCADKKILAFALGEKTAGIVYQEKDGGCKFTHGLPGEVLPIRIRQVMERGL